MENAPIKVTTAVPLPVQQVLDAMTPDNWLQGRPSRGHKMCFARRWCHVHGLDGHDDIYRDLSRRVKEVMNISEFDPLEPPARLNDSASSLGQLKEQITALYRT